MAGVSGQRTRVEGLHTERAPGIPEGSPAWDIIQVATLDHDLCEKGNKQTGCALLQEQLATWRQSLVIQCRESAASPGRQAEIGV